MFRHKTNTPGERLRSLRESKGWTQSELSAQLAAIGIRYSQARISRLERGWTPPSREVLEGLARVLGTTVSHLEAATDSERPAKTSRTFATHEAVEAARLIDELPGAHRAALLSALRAMVGSGDFEIIA